MLFHADAPLARGSILRPVRKLLVRLVYLFEILLRLFLENGIVREAIRMPNLHEIAIRLSNLILRSAGLQTENRVRITHRSVSFA